MLHTERTKPGIGARHRGATNRPQRLLIGACAQRLDLARCKPMLHEMPHSRLAWQHHFSNVLAIPVPAV